MTNHPRPDDPLTCSEVVERLAKCADEVLVGHCMCEPDEICDSCRNLAEFRSQATAILHSWRERRVQELEEALRRMMAAIESLEGTPIEYSIGTELAKSLKEARRLLDSGWREQIRKGAKHE